jgi:hypothetical protein
MGLGSRQSGQATQPDDEPTLTFTLAIRSGAVSLAGRSFVEIEASNDHFL